MYHSIFYTLQFFSAFTLHSIQFFLRYFSNSSVKHLVICLQSPSFQMKQGYKVFLLQFFPYIKVIQGYSKSQNFMPFLQTQPFVKFFHLPNIDQTVILAIFAKALLASLLLLGILFFPLVFLSFQAFLSTDLIDYSLCFSSFITLSLDVQENEPALQLDSSGGIGQLKSKLISSFWSLLIGSNNKGFIALFSHEDSYLYDSTSQGRNNKSRLSSMAPQTIGGFRSEKPSFSSIAILLNKIQFIYKLSQRLLKFRKLQQANNSLSKIIFV